MDPVLVFIVGQVLRDVRSSTIHVASREFKKNVEHDRAKRREKGEGCLYMYYGQE